MTKRIERPPPLPDRVKVALVPEDVARAIAAGKGAGITSEGLLTSLIEAWGGRERFAKDIFAEFQHATPGSMVRQRITEMVSRLTVQVSSQEIARPKAARDMSDEDLLATARSLLERVHANVAGQAEG